MKGLYREDLSYKGQSIYLRTKASSETKASTILHHTVDKSFTRHSSHLIHIRLRNEQGRFHRKASPRLLSVVSPAAQRQIPSSCFMQGELSHVARNMSRWKWRNSLRASPVSPAADMVPAPWKYDAVFLDHLKRIFFLGSSAGPHPDVRLVCSTN